MISIALLVALAAAGCAGTTPPSPETPRASSPTNARPASSEEPPGILGRDWIFVGARGYDGPLPSPPPVAGFIMTREGQRLTGTTACNRLGAGFELDTPPGTLRFTSIRNMRMLCDRVASDTEEAVLDAMIATDSYRLDGNQLELIAKGKVVARLTSND